MSIRLKTRDEIELFVDGLNHVGRVALYGSWARGDARPQSDVDLLCVSKTRKRSQHYPNGANVFFYTEKQLRVLADSKSLFFLHLSTEAVALREEDDWARIQDLLVRDAKYYPATRERVSHLTPLFGIQEKLFRENPTTFVRTVRFALRSLIYARSADDGKVCFSLRELAKHSWEAELLNRLDGDISFDGFRQICEAVRKLGDFDYLIPIKTLEGLALALPVNDFTQKLLVRISGQQDYSYTWL